MSSNKKNNKIESYDPMMDADDQESLDEGLSFDNDEYKQLTNKVTSPLDRDPTEDNRFDTKFLIPEDGL